MDLKKAKEYLRQYKEADRQVKRLEREYEKQLEMIDALGSPLGDGTPHGTNIGNTTAAKALKLIEKTEELLKAKEAAIRVRQEVFDLISSIPGEKGSVLYERYINGLSWEDVADAVNYSLRQVHNIHRDALKIVQDCIELH